MVLKRRSQHHHGCLHSSIAFASTQELESANETEIHTHGSVRPWRCDLYLLHPPPLRLICHLEIERRQLGQSFSSTLVLHGSQCGHPMQLPSDTEGLHLPLLPDIIQELQLWLTTHHPVGTRQPRQISRELHSRPQPDRQPH